MSRGPHRILSDQRGAAASEFALILPLLTMLLFGFYEAGRMYWNYNIVQSSARDAARYAARMPMACDVDGNGAFTDGTDVAEIQNLTRTGTLNGAGDPLIAGWDDNDGIAVSISCIDNGEGDLGGVYFAMSKIPTVSISATAPHGALFGGLLGFSLDTITVSNAQAWTE